MSKYIINHEIVLSAEEIIAKYSDQGNWNKSHTKLLSNAIKNLSPGQMVEITNRQFVVGGEDEEGYWEQELEHPHTIQMMDNEVENLIIERKIASYNYDNIDKQIKSLLNVRNEAEKTLRLNQGKLQKYANSKGYTKI